MTNLLKYPALTPQEQMFLYRRRKGETQAQAALRLGVSYVTYSKAEKGNRDPFEVPEPIEPSTLTDNEICVLMRRSAGLSRTEIAQKIGVSRAWITYMEHGKIGADSLINYWATESAA